MKRKAGYKHRSTNRFLEHLKKEVMALCEREGLHQIDLLSPAPEKVTEAEFRAKIRGQKKLEQINQEIVRKVSNQFPQHSRHRRIFCGKRLMNVLDQSEILKSFNLFSWKNTTYP